jgi:hypothetical protein
VKETEKHQRAFEVYYSLGPSRSLPIVAKRVGASVGAVKKWSRVFNWKQRVEDREAAVSGIVRERVTTGEVDRRSRNLKIVKAGIVATARAIADGKIKPSLADLERMMRLEAEVELEQHRGEPGGEFHRMSLEEVLAVAREEHESLGRLLRLVDGDSTASAPDAPATVEAGEPDAGPDEEPDQPPDEAPDGPSEALDPK